MANKSFVAIGTALLFGDSAQTPDVQITLSALGADGARVSARRDRGTTSVPRLHEWRGEFQWGGTPVVGETVDLYIAESDGTREDGKVGTADAAVSDLDKLLNLTYIGSVIIETTTADTVHVGSGKFTISQRFYSLVVHNAATDALATDTGEHHVHITDIPDEAQ